MRKCWWKMMMGFFFFFLSHMPSIAQCSICTKTSQQQGKEGATGMNSGIIYLMLAPFAIGGYIGYRWWKQEHS